MKFRTRFVFLSLLLAAQALWAQQPAVVKKLVCLTTLTQLKIEATFNKPVSKSATFNIQLKDGDKNVLNTSLAPSLISGNKVVFQVSNLKVIPWQPVHPKLYRFIFSADGNSDIEKNIGFRIFESKNGNVYLNGNPIFLRGIAINPPDRGIPGAVEKNRKFAMDYVIFMKSIHVNIIRIPDDETWYEVCDELGMMVFGGNYGSTVDGEKPPHDYDKAVEWYKNVAYADIASHPSLMIYAMTNEVPYDGKRGQEWEKFLSYAHAKLKDWDNTRLYIANAGYGYGKSGDICDLHRYWGWYYNSPFNFINIRDNEKIIPFKKKLQPITFTECVGNYTGPNGAYNLTPDHKNPGSQLNWTGHADWSIQPKLADEHQSFTFKQATEMFRRLRPINKELSGVFPFTILFYNWNNVQQFIDMGAKPVTKQAKISYQPILVSFENWATQVYAGKTTNPIVYIVNDDDNFQELSDAKFVCQLKNDAQTILSTDTLLLPPIKYYSTWQKKLAVKIPINLVTGNYTLTGRVIKNDKLISENFDKLFITSENVFVAKKSAEILLYDPAGATANALSKTSLHIKSIKSFNSIPQNSFLLIGENSADGLLAGEAEKIKRYIKNGGRVLCLRQNEKMLPNVNNILNTPFKNIITRLDVPSYPPPARPSRNGLYINPERPNHAVFDGIDREQLKVWSDYTNWDITKPGYPAIYPVTDGFVPYNKEDIENISVLANYGVGLEGIALAEVFNEKGSLVLCGFDLVNRFQLDPVADKILMNLLNYLTDGNAHQQYPLITQPIIWGDYTSEKGLLTGINSGLMVNAVPLVPENNKSKITVTKKGDRFLGAPGGFNTRPGVQYVAFGRRMFGPYYLRGFGNVPEPKDTSSNIGEGYFWCSIPQGKTTAVSTVWNQSSETLSITIKVNNEKEVGKEIKAGETINIPCPVNYEKIKMHFKGDRRLVLLQTAFY